MTIRYSHPISRLLSVVVLALALSGCGVLTGGTTKTISVNSNPSTARLTTEPLTGSFTTPAALELERKKTYTLVLWKEGYEETQYPIIRKMRTVPLIIDIFCLACIVVDAVTGGWWDLQPETVTVTLPPLQDGLEPIEVRIFSGGDETAPIRVESTESVHIRLIEN